MLDVFLRIDYIALIPILVNAIKDQQDEIDLLKEEISKLKDGLIRR